MKPLGPAPAEKQLMQQVLALARLCRWRSYHTHDSRRSARGFPDLLLVRHGRLILAELKSAEGKVTASQQEWLTDLSTVKAVETYLWRPGDWDVIVERLKSNAK